MSPLHARRCSFPSACNSIITIMHGVMCLCACFGGWIGDCDDDDDEG
jgi:hypothetical protein